MYLHLCCGKENFLWDVAHTTGDDSQCYTGKHVSVVSLTGIEGASIWQSHLFKGASTSKYTPTLWYTHMKLAVWHNGRYITPLSLAAYYAQKPSVFYLSERVALLCCALSFACRIAEGKNDWSLIVSCHIFDDFLSKGTTYSSHTCIRDYIDQ